MAAQGLPGPPKIMLKTFPVRPQALPERLRDASRAPRARPRSHQRVLESSRGIQKSFRELKILHLDAPRPSNCKLSSLVFPPSQAVVRQCTPERLRCGLATSASCPSAPQVSGWPRRGSRGANKLPARSRLMATIMTSLLSSLFFLLSYLSSLRCPCFP